MFQTMKKEIIEKWRLLMECVRMTSDPEIGIAVALHSCRMPGIGEVPVISVIHNNASDTADIYPVAIVLDNERSASLEGLAKLENLTFLNCEEKEDETEDS